MCFPGQNRVSKQKKSPSHFKLHATGQFGKRTVARPILGLQSSNLHQNDENKIPDQFLRSKTGLETKNPAVDFPGCSYISLVATLGKDLSLFHMICHQWFFSLDFHWKFFYIIKWMIVNEFKNLKLKMYMVFTQKFEFCFQIFIPLLLRNLIFIILKPPSLQFWNNERNCFASMNI